MKRKDNSNWRTPKRQKFVFRKKNMIECFGLQQAYAFLTNSRMKGTGGA
jgi:hypothetical protein